MDTSSLMSGEGKPPAASRSRPSALPRLYGFWATVPGPRSPAAPQSIPESGGVPVGRGGKWVVLGQGHMSGALFPQYLICLSVDLLFVRCAQFALMLHLRGASLRIPGVAFIRHWVFTFFWEPKFLLGLRFLLRCCKFWHRTSPSPTGKHVRFHRQQPRARLRRDRRVEGDSNASIPCPFASDTPSPRL